MIAAMRISRCLSLLLVGTSLLLAAPSAFPESAAHASSSRRWQPPPPPRSWPAQKDHGYMDGVQAAWLDLSSGYKPQPSRHMQYRQPPDTVISGRYWYREGFRRGYQAVYRHNRKVHPHHPDLAVQH